MSKPLSTTTKRILMVEDDRDVREVFEELLTLRGFTVQTAENGREALDLLAAAPDTPDVILLDLMMPVMDGYAFAKQAKLETRLAGIPIFVMSANSMQDEPELADARFFRKPLDLPRLLEELDAEFGPSAA